MDKPKKKKAYSFSNKSKIEGLKNKKELRLRLIKLTNNYFKPRCEHFINSIRSFNLKIMEYSGGRKTIEKEIKENNNFRFGKKRDYFVHLTDLSPYIINVVPFLKNLKNNFTQDELDIIKKDKEYYLTNELLKENISAFNVPPLYKIINKEEYSHIPESPWPIKQLANLNCSNSTNDNQSYYTSVNENEEYWMDYYICKGLNTWKDLIGTKATILDTPPHIIEQHLFDGNETGDYIKGSIRVTTKHKGELNFSIALPHSLPDQNANPTSGHAYISAAIYCLRITCKNKF